MQSYIDNLYQRTYGAQIVESRRQADAYHRPWSGKAYNEILSEKLASADEVLYRRGNFSGTWDQLIVDSLREEYDTQLAFSPGVRWGTSVIKGQDITMEHVMDQTSMTYGESYRSQMTGAQLKNYARRGGRKSI